MHGVRPSLSRGLQNGDTLWGTRIARCLRLDITCRARGRPPRDRRNLADSVSSTEVEYRLMFRCSGLRCSYTRAMLADRQAPVLPVL